MNNILKKGEEYSSKNDSTKPMATRQIDDSLIEVEGSRNNTSPRCRCRRRSYSYFYSYCRSCWHFHVGPLLTGNDYQAVSLFDLAAAVVSTIVAKSCRKKV